MELDPARVESARARLRGQLVATPLIGGLELPGFPGEPSLRIKPESLQPSGSIWFRGAMHEVARQLGKTKGLLVAGDDRPLLAAARAAALQRVPTVVFLRGEQNRLRALLPDAVEVEVVADAVHARDAVEAARGPRGFRPMPGIEDPEYALGIATLPHRSRSRPP